jgi:Protein of unknown function (DUF2855)
MTVQVQAAAERGQRLLVARNELRRTQLGADPDAPAQRALRDGEVRLATDHFALTANNITYAAFGETMRYWQFFPAADAAWGCVPVWGFAVVSESRAEGVAVGQRVYGYLPMGTHLVVQPGRISARGFVDLSPHRQELPAAYNQLNFCAADPAYLADREAQQAILRPLFTTSFLIDDFLAEDDFFGAKQVWLSSASSKTAYGTAFCLSRRRGSAQAVRVVGLTSKANLAFTRSLGCYDEVRSYDEVPVLDAQTPAVYIDFAGNAALRLAVHERLNEQLRYSCSVGGTHWEGMGGGKGLPGPKPVLFFAPTQLKKRLAPPPAGWGADGFVSRMDQAWQAFMVPVCDLNAPWLVVESASGAAAIEHHYQALLEGRSDARHGLMLSF